MRNLKKVLSLALALVMLLGMMMVGAGAVDTGFKDDAGIKDDFKAAAAVTKALGVMTGDGTNLNPTGKIVRAEAFILSLRVDGSNADAIAAKWPVVEKPFDDVSIGKWYAHHLAYGKEMGLINGSNGSYNPDGNVTVVEYSILLLKQMGFDAERYTGARWNINAANDAAKAGLYDGLGSVNYYTHELTRQEACQMAFNSLLYSPNGDRTDFVVTATNNSTNQTETLYSGTNETAAYLVYTQAKGDSTTYPNHAIKVTEETTTVDSLGEQAFGLIRTKTVDDLGRTAVSYTAPRYKLNLVIAEGADYTFEGKVTNRTLYNTLGKDVATTYTWNVKIDGVQVMQEADPDTPLNAKPTTSSSAYQDTTAGALTEIYVKNEGEGKKEVNVFISYYRVGTVSKVVPSKNGDPRYVMIDGKKYETEAFEAKDIVVYTLNGTDIETAMLAPELTGNLTRIVNDTTFTLDGKTYVCGKYQDKVVLNKDGLGKDFTFYTDPMGNIMKLKGQAAVSEAKYLWVVANSSAQENPDYITSTTYPWSYKAYGIKADGTVEEWNVITVDGVKVHPTGKQADGTTDLEYDSDGEGTMVAYHAVQNNDGAHYGMYSYSAKGNSLQLTTVDYEAEEDIKVNKPGITYGTGSDGKTAVANSKTTFVFFKEKSASDHTIVSNTVQVGIANIGTDIDVSAVATGVGVDKNTVQVVFVKRPYDDGSVTDEAGVAYLLAGSEKKIDWIEDGKKSTRYEYTGIDATGDEVTMTYSSKLSGDDGETPYGGEVWSFDEDYKMIASLTGEERQWAEAAVEYISTDAVKLGDIDHAFNITDDTSVVFVDDSQGGELSAGDKVIMVTEAGSSKPAHWNAQVVYVTGAATTGSAVTPSDVKNDDGDVTGWTVNPDVGDSFTVNGKDNVGADDRVPVIVPGNNPAGFDDWHPANGNVSDVMGFTFAIDKEADAGCDFVLVIKDNTGKVLYEEVAECSGSYAVGVFYVQVVNTVRGQTTVSNAETFNDDNSELPVADGYTWSVTRYEDATDDDEVGSIVSNGRFDIETNGNNTAP